MRWLELPERADRAHRAEHAERHGQYEGHEPCAHPMPDGGS